MPLPNRLIIDANVAFSFFKQDSARKIIIKKLLGKGISLIAPDFIFEELLNNKEKRKKFSGISDKTFSINFSLLRECINPYSDESYSKHISEALEIDRSYDGEPLNFGNVWIGGNSVDHLQIQKRSKSNIPENCQGYFYFR